MAVIEYRGYRQPQQPARGRQQPWFIVLAALIMGGSIVISTFAAADAIRYTKEIDSTLLTVDGSMQQVVTSDAVRWSSSFSRRVSPNNLKDGYAQMKNDLDVILRYFAEQGVTSKEITVSPPMLDSIGAACSQPSSSDCHSDITGYQLMQNVEVGSSDVNRITQIAQDSSAVTGSGIIFSSRKLEYYYTKLPDLRIQLLAAATKDAQVRAANIAGSTGTKLGRLITASSGDIEVTPINATYTGTPPFYDTTTILKQVRVVVHASFRLDP